MDAETKSFLYIAILTVCIFLPAIIVYFTIDDNFIRRRQRKNELR